MEKKSSIELVDRHKTPFNPPHLLDDEREGAPNGSSVDHALPGFGSFSNRDSPRRGRLNSGGNAQNMLIPGLRDDDMNMLPQRRNTVYEPLPFDE